MEHCQTDSEITVVCLVNDISHAHSKDPTNLNTFNTLSLSFVFTDVEIPENPEAYVKLTENILKQSTGRLSAKITKTLCITSQLV